MKFYFELVDLMRLDFCFFQKVIDKIIFRGILFCEIKNLIFEFQIIMRFRNIIEIVSF